METRIDRPLGHPEDPSNHGIGHEWPEAPKLLEGGLVFPTRPLVGPGDRLATQFVILLGETALEDPLGAPGPVAPRRYSFEARPLGLEEAPGMAQGLGQPLLGEAGVFGHRFRLPVPGVPRALQEEVEHARSPRLPVPPRVPSAASGALGRGARREGRRVLSLILAPPLVLLPAQEEGRALAGALALAPALFRASLALGEKAETRDDIGIEARSALAITIEKGSDPRTIGEKGFGRRIGAVEAAEAGLGVEVSGQICEKLLTSPRRGAPLPPSLFQPKFSHASLLGAGKIA